MSDPAAVTICYICARPVYKSENKIQICLDCHTKLQALPKKE